jgi:hypothetical protein
MALIGFPRLAIIALINYLCGILCKKFIPIWKFAPKLLNIEVMVV